MGLDRLDLFVSKTLCTKKLLFEANPSDPRSAAGHHLLACCRCRNCILKCQMKGVFWNCICTCYTVSVYMLLHHRSILYQSYSISQLDPGNIRKNIKKLVDTTRVVASNQPSFETCRPPRLGWQMPPQKHKQTKGKLRQGDSKGHHQPQYIKHIIYRCWNAQRQARKPKITQICKCVEIWFI